MFKKIRKFTKLSSEEKKLFLEAYMTLGIIRIKILIVSFKRLTRNFEQSTYKKQVSVLSSEESELAKNIGKAIISAAAYTPWKSSCLPQSFTAQKMLQKRGISGVLCLGVTKDKECKEKIKAHAWTKCGESIITGGTVNELYTVVSVFEWVNIDDHRKCVR